MFDHISKLIMVASLSLSQFGMNFFFFSNYIKFMDLKSPVCSSIFSLLFSVTFSSSSAYLRML